MLCCYVSGLHAERTEDDNVAYMAQFDQLDLDLDFTPYDDPPPPYSPPKTPQVPMGEAPPPYEEMQPSENNNTYAAGDVPSLGTVQSGSVRSMAENNDAAVPQESHSQAEVHGSRRSSSQTGGPRDETTLDVNLYPDYNASTEIWCPSQLNNDVSSAPAVDGHDSSRVQPEKAAGQNCRMSSNVAHRRPRVARQSSDSDGKCAATTDNCWAGRGETADNRSKCSTGCNSPGAGQCLDECPGSGFHGADGCGNRRSSGIAVFSACEIEHAAKNLHCHRRLSPTDLGLSDDTTCGRVVQGEGTGELSFPTDSSEGSYSSEGACGGDDIHPYQSTEPSLGHLCQTVPAARESKISTRRPRRSLASHLPVVALPSPDVSICHSPMFVRSSSVASQISVCSETGERRQHGSQFSGSPRPSAVVHNYDAPPAEARIRTNNLTEECAGGSLTCGDLSLRRGRYEKDSVDNRFDVWQTRQCGTNGLDSNMRVDPRIGRHASLDGHACANNKPCGQNGNIAAHSQCNIIGGSRDNDMARGKAVDVPAPVAQLPMAAPLSRLVYHDGLGDDVDNKHARSVDSNSSFQNVGESSLCVKDETPHVARTRSGASPSQVCVDGGRRAKRSSGLASSSQVCDLISPDRGCQHEKTTLRQLKKKKRRPHSSPGQSVDVAGTRSTNDIVNYQRLDKDKKSTPSPGRGAHRRTQKQHLDNPAMYKEYGFIDTPESSRPHLVNGDISKSLSGYLSLCKLQHSEDAANTNADGYEGKAPKRCRETSKERDLSFNHDGSGSRRPKRCSRPVSYLD